MKIFKSFYIQPGSGCLHALLAIGVRMPWVCCWFNLYADNNNKRLAVKYNARGKWDLLPSFVHAKSYGYIMGSLCEVQLQCMFSDFPRKPWWLLGMSYSHRACLREEYVLQKQVRIGQKEDTVWKSRFITLRDLSEWTVCFQWKKNKATKYFYAFMSVLRGHDCRGILE